MSVMNFKFNFNGTIKKSACNYVDIKYLPTICARIIQREVTTHPVKHFLKKQLERMYVCVYVFVCTVCTYVYMCMYISRKNAYFASARILLLA